MEWQRNVRFVQITRNIGAWRSLKVARYDGSNQIVGVSDNFPRTASIPHLNKKVTSCNLVGDILKTFSFLMTSRVFRRTYCVMNSSKLPLDVFLMFRPIPTIINNNNQLGRPKNYIRADVCLYLTYGRWASTCQVTNPTYCNVAILPAIIRIFPSLALRFFIAM